MANRTFKVYGQAYAASGDVNVTMTVGGTQVFNGAVNDSTTVRSGPPSTENHLWTYEMDENTVGELAVSIAVTGGELCVGPTQHTLAHTKIIPDAWWEENDSNLELAENQTYIANQIGQVLLDAEQAGLYDKLIAGTSTREVDGAAIQAANVKGPRSPDIYKPVVDERKSAQINGESLEHWDELTVNVMNWPILQDGDTLTYTWVFDPDADAL